MSSLNRTLKQTHALEPHFDSMAVDFKTEIH